MDSESPQPYDVSYSQRVMSGLHDLLESASKRGKAAPVVAAIKRFDYLFRVYPQFGDPLRDFSIPSTKLYLGQVSPLVVRYVVDEEHRQVLIGSLFQTYSGFDK